MDLPTSLKSEYSTLSTDRDPYLQRARECAKYTLPTLIPLQGKTSGGRLRRGYSNFGARCVNSMSAKLLLALLPARQAFFRYVLEDSVLAQIGGKEMLTEVEAALASVEAAIQTDIETTPTRAPAGEVLKHLIVGGNALAYDLPTGGLKLYPLSHYVCQRDGEGNVLSIIAEDHLSPRTLPPELRAAVQAKLEARRAGTEKSVCVYTGIFRTNTKWVTWKEVEGIRVPGSDGSYPIDASPWMPLRWTPVDQESYGRGMVEDYLGYFISLEGLTNAVVKGTAAAVKLVYLRNPNGTTKAANITRAETGDVVDGKDTDITVLQSQKQADLNGGMNLCKELKDELAFAFALHSAVQRNGERVTAEEIRYLAQDLDGSLGGNYSALSMDFQLPLLKSRSARLTRQRKLPALPDKALKPMIVTGLDALGRGAELDNLKALVEDIVSLGGPDALSTYLYFDNLLKRLTTARGVKPEGLIKPTEVVAQETQAKQMAAMVQQLGPNAITQMGQLTKQGMQGPATQGP